MDLCKITDQKESNFWIEKIYHWGSLVYVEKKTGRHGFSERIFD